MKRLFSLLLALTLMLTAGAMAEGMKRPGFRRTCWCCSPATCTAGSIRASATRASNDYTLHIQKGRT